MQEGGSAEYANDYNYDPTASAATGYDTSGYGAATAAEYSAAEYDASAYQGKANTNSGSLEPRAVASDSD